MREVILILKKELHNMRVRGSMVKWYVLLILMNALIPFLPNIAGIPLTNNKALLSIVFILFTSFLVPNNLSIDTIGGEKYHKTLETVLSTSITLRSIFIGKSLFIIFMGAISILASTVLDYFVLKIAIGTSFLELGYSAFEWITLYCLAILSISLIAIVGSAVSLISSNLKTNGYLITVLNVFLVMTIYKVLIGRNFKLAAASVLILFLVCAGIYWSVAHHMTKQQVMNYIR